MQLAIVAADDALQDVVVPLHVVQRADLLVVQLEVDGAQFVLRAEESVGDVLVGEEDALEHQHLQLEGDVVGAVHLEQPRVLKVLQLQTLQRRLVDQEVLEGVDAGAARVPPRVDGRQLRQEGAGRQHVEAERITLLARQFAEFGEAKHGLVGLSALLQVHVEQQHPLDVREEANEVDELVVNVLADVRQGLRRNEVVHRIVHVCGSATIPTMSTIDNVEERSLARPHGVAPIHTQIADHLPELPEQPVGDGNVHNIAGTTRLVAESVTRLQNAQLAVSAFGVYDGFREAVQVHRVAQEQRQLLRQPIAVFHNRFELLAAFRQTTNLFRFEKFEKDFQHFWRQIH